MHVYRWRVRLFGLSTRWQQAEHWYIAVFSCFECGNVWILYHTMLLDIQPDRSFTVSDYNKAMVIAVCIPIDIVHAIPYVSTSSFHLYRVMVSLSSLLSVQNCLWLILSQVSVWVRMGHQIVLVEKFLWTTFSFINSPSRPKVRERGVSAWAKSWLQIFYFIFSFKQRCYPHVFDVDKVRLYKPRKRITCAQEILIHLSHRF